MLPNLLCLGKICIHSYGVMVFLGIVAGWAVLRRLTMGEIAKKRLEDVVFFSVIWAIVGARVFYFLFWDFESLKADPFSFFYIWQGGLAIYGAFTGGLVSLFFYSKKLKIPFLKILDFFAPAFAVGQAIGRIGCTLAGCCYGKPTDWFFGVKFNNPLSLAPHGVKLIPTQPMESVLDFLLFLFLFSRAKTKKHKVGEVFALYIIGYSTIRFFLEFLRGDTVAGFLNLTAMQNIALIGIALGIFLLIWKRKQRDLR